MNINRIRTIFVLFIATVTTSVYQAGFAGNTDSARGALERATYAGIENQPVTLADGHWQGAPHSEMEVTGPLSLNLLEGSHWRLVEMDKRQALPEDGEITLLFSGDRITGKSACNRYSAGIGEGENPGDIIVGQSMGTRMACADHLMALERQYIEMLLRLTSFSFHAGKLVLNGRESDGTPFSMFFIAEKVENQ